MRFLSQFILIFVLIINYLFAQNVGKNPKVENYNRKVLSLYGDIGLYGEYYNTNSPFARRPKGTGRLFFRPTIDLYGTFQVAFEFLLSTEGNSTTKDINQFGISPKWGWGLLNIGDFSTEFSRYTLSGIQIRGGGINLTPGNFRFSTVFGFTKRSALGGSQEDSYKRFLVASKIGYGNEAVSFLDLIFLRAKDDISSLEQNTQNITVITPNGNDVLEIGSLVPIIWSSYGITGVVKIEISRNGGSTYEVIVDNHPNVGHYNWTVTGPSTLEALIRITSVESPNVFDVSDSYFTIGIGVPTKISPNTKNIGYQLAVTPQENLVVGTKGRISFFNNGIAFDFDAAGSVYTRDLRAMEINLDSVNVPDFVKKIYKPRVGTNADYAFNTSLGFGFKYFSLKLGYRRIQPGFYSLGVPYLHNDIQEISVMNSLNIYIFNLNLNYSNQSDNLLNQKIYTTSRNIINAGINARISRFWLVSVSGNILSMQNNAKNDSTKINFNSYILSFSNSLNFHPKSFLRSFNINYSLQNSDNKSYLLKNNKTIVHSLNLGSNFGLSKDFSMSLSAGFINSTLSNIVKSFTQNYGINFAHKSFSDKLNSTLSLSSGFSQGNKTYRASLSSSYNLTNTSIISFVTSFMTFSGQSFRGGKFNEFISSLSYNHRF